MSATSEGRSSTCPLPPAPCRCCCRSSFATSSNMWPGLSGGTDGCGKSAKQALMGCCCCFVGVILFICWIAGGEPRWQLEDAGGTHRRRAGWPKPA